MTVYPCTYTEEFRAVMKTDPAGRPNLTPADRYDIKDRGRVFTFTHSPWRCPDISLVSEQLVGKEIYLNWIRYKIQGVELRARLGRFDHRDSIGLLVERT